MFKLWSEVNPDAKNILKPDFGLRDWNNLSKVERINIFKHLEIYFIGCYDGNFGNNYVFCDGDNDYKKNRIVLASSWLNDKYKAKVFGINYFTYKTEEAAFFDFHSICISGEANVFLELLSFYCIAYLDELGFYDHTESMNITKEIKEEDSRLRVLENFKEFTSYLNKIFADFGVNV